MAENAGATGIRAVRGAGAGRGIGWWTDSAALLFGSLPRLATWVGMSVFFLLAHLLYWLPFVGSLVSFVLAFLLTGGLMIAAAKTRRGQAVVFSDLFSAFGPHAGALVSVSLMVLVGFLVLGLTVAFAGIGGLLVSAWEAAVHSELEALPVESFEVGWGALLIALAALLLCIPVSMAAWLAPALIVLRNVNPVDALRLSLAACWHNAGALTVYGLAGTGFLLLAAVTFAGWLVFLPLAFLSTHAAFCELFEGGIEVLDARPGHGIP